MNALTLVQASPQGLPDTLELGCVVSGNYTSGTADPLTLSPAGVADPEAIGMVPPLNNFGSAPPPVDPEWHGFAGGYYAQVQRTVAGGVTSFGLRWFASEGSELGSGAFPAAITGGRHYIRVKVNIATQE